jgi:hypothetical protein
MLCLIIKSLQLLLAELTRKSEPVVSTVFIKIILHLTRWKRVAGWGDGLSILWLNDWLLNRGIAAGILSRILDGVAQSAVVWLPVSGIIRVVASHQIVSFPYR